MSDTYKILELIKVSKANFKSKWIISKRVQMKTYNDKTMDYNLLNQLQIKEFQKELLDDI